MNEEAVRIQLDYLVKCYNHNPEIFSSNVNMRYILYILKGVLFFCPLEHINGAFDVVERLYFDAMYSPATVNSASIIEALDL
jgi:hypothetical protein